ncbi:hypothetical protein VTN77DRAFT_4966 [Rasamsonia byssochlamydoides]|uniref:uncharacterized protein n=1 Tax=Rasamsonia byssochlamydoides TaxID=89139 RepID=UPI003744038E
MPRVVYFYEQRATPIDAIFGENPSKETPSVIFVSESSACLDLTASSDKYPLRQTHFDMIKFGGPDEQGFRLVRSIIQEMANKGLELVRSRTQVDREIQQIEPSSSVPYRSGSGKQKRTIPWMINK